MTLGSARRLGACLGTLRHALPVSDKICPDSGASVDMFPDRSCFVTYIPLVNCFVRVANNHQTPVLGRGTVSIQLGATHLVRLINCLHVPALDMPLLSIRVHCRRGPGCTFLADPSGCYLTFPTFLLPVDDSSDCLLPYAPAPLASIYAYDDTCAPPGLPPSPPSVTRLALKRALAPTMCWPVHRVVPLPVGSYTPSPSPTLLDVVPAPSQPPPAAPAVMTCECPESFGPQVRRFSSHDLHKLFGNRKFRNYSIFATVATGIRLSETFEPPLSIGDVVNIKRGPSGSALPRPTSALHRVGVDIGFGDGVSPGGFRYCLMLVDQYSRKTWCYGLKDLASPSIIAVFWRFFVDSGGIPRILQCDFDQKFLGGPTNKLLTSKGIRVNSAPPLPTIPKRPCRIPLASCCLHGPLLLGGGWPS